MRASAVARPRPLEAPVTSATLPFSPRSITPFSQPLLHGAARCGRTPSAHGRPARSRSDGALRRRRARGVPAPARVPAAHRDSRGPGREHGDGAVARRARGGGGEPAAPHAAARPAQSPRRHLRGADDGEPVLRPLPGLAARGRRAPGRARLHDERWADARDPPPGARLPGLRLQRPRPLVGRRAHPGQRRRHGRLPALGRQRRVLGRLLRAGRPAASSPPPPRPSPPTTASSARCWPRRIPTASTCTRRSPTATRTTRCRRAAGSRTRRSSPRWRPRASTHATSTTTCRCRRSGARPGWRARAACRSTTSAARPGRCRRSRSSTRPS